MFTPIVDQSRSKTEVHIPPLGTCFYPFTFVFPISIRGNIGFYIKENTWNSRCINHNRSLRNRSNRQKVNGICECLWTRYTISSTRRPFARYKKVQISSHMCPFSRSTRFLNARSGSRSPNSITPKKYLLLSKWQPSERYLHTGNTSLVSYTPLL